MNRIIPTILLIVLLVLLGGYIFLSRTDMDLPTWKIKQKETIPITFEDTNKQELQNAEKDAETYTTAIKEKRLDLCDAITRKEKKDECRDMIAAADALEEKNPELCSVLTNEGIRERCLDNITYFQATEGGDASLCSGIKDETIKTQCIQNIDELQLESHLASGSLDIEICNSLSTEELQSDCKRKITTEKDSEFYREALSNTSLQSCDGIADVVVKGKCRDMVLYDLAVKEGNLDYCSDIISSEQSDYCRKSLLGRQDVSRYQQFVRSGDLESCEKLTVIQMKQQCHDTIIFAQVRENQDIGLCDLLYNTGITSQCREMLEIKKN